MVLILNCLAASCLSLKLFLIAMDDSDWASHDSNLAGRWHMLADFD